MPDTAEVPPDLADGWAWSEDGSSLELETPMQLIEPEDVTLDVLTRGCMLLGLDPDSVLAGEEVELPERPPVAEAQVFFAMVVKNSEEYDLAAMQWSRAQSLLAVVVDHFINARPRQ